MKLSSILSNFSLDYRTDKSLTKKSIYAKQFSLVAVLDIILINPYVYPLHDLYHKCITLIAWPFQPQTMASLLKNRPFREQAWFLPCFFQHASRFGPFTWHNMAA